LRNLRPLLSSSIALLTFVISCAPQPPAVPSPSPSIVPATFAGPEMKVASTISYVDGSLVVAVPAGSFTMGNDGADNPTHSVTLSDFWIYSTKVTNQQYALCVQTGGCSIPDKKDNPLYSDPGNAGNPVVGVTYDQAAAYCTYVHALLPTEAQWEKTARGPDGTPYPWGNNAPSCDLLNYNKCIGQTTNVTIYPKGQSYYQALDMEGNAFEWVADWYGKSYYKNSPPQDPTGPDTGQSRSVRSSSFESKAGLIPAATRFHELPTNHRNDLSFRCVVPDPTHFAPFCQTVVINGLNGAPPPGACASPSIKSEPACLFGNTVPGEIITYQPYPVQPPSFVHILNVGSGCVQMAGNKWDCAFYGGSGFSILYFCSYDLPGNSSCVPGYTYDPVTKHCKPNVGTSGACIAGYNYDPANQCCSAVPGSAGPYSPCPPGYIFSGNSCSRFSSTTIYLVTPGVCAQPTQKGCKAQSCGAGYAWNSDQCACVCTSC
jgi:formylglycine-generating enzyme